MAACFPASTLHFYIDLCEIVSDMVTFQFDKDCFSLFATSDELSLEITVPNPKDRFKPYNFESSVSVTTYVMEISKKLLFAKGDLVEVKEYENCLNFRIFNEEHDKKIDFTVAGIDEEDLTDGGSDEEDLTWPKDDVRMIARLDFEVTDLEETIAYLSARGRDEVEVIVSNAAVTFLGDVTMVCHLNRHKQVMDIWKQYEGEVRMEWHLQKLTKAVSQLARCYGNKKIIVCCYEERCKLFTVEARAEFLCDIGEDGTIKFLVSAPEDVESKQSSEVESKHSSEEE